LAHPVLPNATQKIWQQLGLAGRIEDQRMDELRWGQLRAGTRIGKPEALFPRVDKDEAIEKIEQLEHEWRHEAIGRPVPAQQGAARSGEPAKEAKANVITIEEFAKVDMRVGAVRSAERVPGTDKLLKLLVDIGDEVRQVVAGIAEAYAPEQLLGRKVILVTNIEPRKLRGVESNGMIVAAAAGAQGRPVLATFTEEVPLGARLK
jgi:methionyl-tRNA synthetase